MGDGPRHEPDTLALSVDRPLDARLVPTAVSGSRKRRETGRRPLVVRVPARPNALARLRLASQASVHCLALHHAQQHPPRPGAMPLGKRTDCGDAKYAGLEVPFASDIEVALQVG